MMTKFLQSLFWKGLIAVGLSLLLPQALFAENPNVTVTKIDGSKLSGEMIAWNATGVTLQIEQESVTVASSQLLRAQWRNEKPSEERHGKFLELVDGTRLPHQGYEVVESQATITTQLATQPIILPTNRIAYVQLSSDAPSRDQLDTELEGDVLVIRKKSTGAFDNLSGILGDVSQRQVEFTWDGEVIPVKRSKIAALVYFHARKPLAKKSVCWLVLQGGGRLPVVEMSWQDHDIQLRTSGGIELSIPVTSLRDADYSQGKIAYLSDLQPIEQRWTPRIGLPPSAALIRQHGLPRRDQSFAGSALALQWPATKPGALGGERRTYSKGLAMRSRTECRYRLPKGMRRFVTLAGIDPETANQGNVTLEIFVDRRSVWQGEIDGDAAPTAIDVALGDARELRIVVDYGENLDFGDRLHLIEARLSR